MSKSLNPGDFCRIALGVDARPLPPTEEIAPQHTILWDMFPGYGMSAADGNEQKILKGTQDCFNPEAPPLTENAVFNIASITKPFTGAVILRMIESEEFAPFFPEGLNTKLSSFRQIIKERYPDSDYAQTRLDSEDERIEAKDLLRHSSGIGEADWRDESSKNLFWAADAKPSDGKFLEAARLPGKYDEYQYSDLGFELLGMLVSAVATKARGRTVTFGEILRELVIDRLGLEKTFTSEEMSVVGDEIKVTGRPEQEVAQGYICRHDGELIKSNIFRFCMSASAIYSTPQDLCKFAKAAWDDKIFSEGGLFEKQETIVLRDSFEIELIDGKGKIVGDAFYGMGFVRYDEDGKTFRCHYGATSGYSSALIYADDGRVAACVINCQSLTSYFANALLDQEIKSGKVSESEEEKQLRFWQLSNELLEEYSKEELVDALKKSGLVLGEREFARDAWKSNSEGLLRELANIRIKTESATVAVTSSKTALTNSNERVETR